MHHTMRIQGSITDKKALEMAIPQEETGNPLSARSQLHGMDHSLSFTKCICALLYAVIK